MKFEEWWYANLSLHKEHPDRRDIVQAAWQASRFSTIEECIVILRSLPCIGCKLKDRSHFSDCPKYNEEWLVEEIRKLGKE